MSATSPSTRSISAGHAAWGKRDQVLRQRPRLVTGATQAEADERLVVTAAHVIDEAEPRRCGRQLVLG